MSDLTWRDARHNPAPNDKRIKGRRSHGLRPLAVALLSSLCLVSSLTAAAQASPQPHAAATTPTVSSSSIGGWNLVRHWTYDEVQANKDITSKLASSNPALVAAACQLLGAIPYVGLPLRVYCSVQAYLVAGTARKARAAGHCFRFVVPAHNPNWTYPSTYSGGWCR